MNGRFLLGASLLIVVPITSATAQTFIGRNFTGTTSSAFIPPDTMGAAGIDYFVELNNARFRVYRKSDGMLVQESTLNQFWTAAGAPPVVRSLDPRILYDPHARRWYATAIDNPANANNILFAISSSSDPTQPWTGFTFDSDTDDSNWADFTMLGYNGEGVFVSAFMPTLGAAPARTSFIGMIKAGLLETVPSLANMAHFQDVDQSTAGPIPQLAVDADNVFGNSMPVLAMSSFGGGSIVRADITPLGAPVVANVGSTFLASSQPPTVAQPGAPAVQDLESNDWRFSSNTVQRGNDLYAVQAIDDGGRAAVRFLRFDVVSNALIENTVIGDPARAYTFPSIAVNDFGDIVIGVTGTSSSEFASSYALVRRAGGAVFDPILLKAGTSNYVVLDSQNRNRWGDYSATTVDPADPGIVWTNQEFAGAALSWSTQASELVLLQPDEIRWAEPMDGVFDDPTMWLTAHGAAPQPSDHVVVSRATDPGGSFTISLPPAPVYMNQSVSIRQGNVLLDLGGNPWDLALHLEVGPYYGSPQATVANGTLNSVAGIIGLRPTSEGHLTLDNAQWNVAADLLVGSAPAPGALCFPTVCMPGANGGTGSLTIDNNSQVDVTRTLHVWKAGTVNLNDGVLTADTIQHTSGGNFNFTGGTLHVSTFNGELRNTGGTLAPGTSIGVTNVHPGYFQLPGGTLAIELGGTSGADYDQLVTGLAALDGMLDVSLVGGFMPSLSDVFNIIHGGGVLGAFATTLLPNLGPLLDWQLVYQPSSVALAVVPALPGDYNADGTVDAGDYVTWRDTLGQMGIGLAADGNFDGQVNLLDYAVWRAHFGQSVPGSGAGMGATDPASAVPEPATWLLVIAAVGAMLFAPRRSVARSLLGRQ